MAIKQQGAVQSGCGSVSGCDDSSSSHDDDDDGGLGVAQRDQPAGAVAERGVALRLGRMWLFVAKCLARRPVARSQGSVFGSGPTQPWRMPAARG